MHKKFMLALLGIFVALKLTETKYILSTTENADIESSEVLSDESTEEETISTASEEDNNLAKSLKDLLEKFNITSGEHEDPKVFLPYVPYIILAVVVFGLVYVVKMFLDFMKFCAKFYTKFTNSSSKETETSGKGVQTSAIELETFAKEGDSSSKDVETSVKRVPKSNSLSTLPKELETKF